ncbi:MAG TPA: methyltransferase [Methanotrichaceae archaeon]|nr:methyltransferase [Methanotrichaceae archaeon]
MLFGGDRIKSDYKSDYWRNFWSGKRDAGHRSHSESYLYNEACERLYHLEGGDSILDVGCGTCDLLAYYALHYSTVVGADFAPSMLEGARQRLDEFHIAHVELIEADDESIWNKLSPGSTFDRITAGMVVQNLTLERVGSFIENAKARLNEGGKIVLFDIMEPKNLALWEAGLWKDDEVPWARVSRYLIMAYLGRKLNMLRGLPERRVLGFAYTPKQISDIAKRCSLSAAYANAMYYEYRYHAILTRNADNGT